MATELGTGYVTLIPSAKGIAAATQAELGGPVALAGRKSGAATSAGFASSFKKGIKTMAVGAAVIGGVAAIGEKFEGAFNTIARGTGETGATLKSLDDSFKNVLKSGAGSFDQVSAAITTLHQRTGLTGAALEDFASKEVTLARITKTDVGANLQATTGLFNLYGVAVHDQSAKLDVLFRASQVAGVSVTQLASEMQTAAPTAKILGLNIDQTAALVANLDKAGLPAGKTMQGLAGAFAKAAKAGKDPLSVIHDLTAEIKAAPTPTAAATIAVQKYGIGARQAAGLVAGLRSGAIDLDGTLKGGKGILETAAATQTLSGKLANLKNRALVGLEPLATAVLGGLTRAVADVIPVVETLTGHMNILGPILVGAAAGFVAFKVALGIQALISGVGAAFTALSGAIFGTAEAEGVAAVASEGLLASIGPIGFVAIAAGAALAIFTGKNALFGSSQKESTKATDDFVASLRNEGLSLDETAQKVVLKGIREHKNFSSVLSGAGITVKEFSDALSGNAKAYESVSKKLDAYRKAADAADSQVVVHGNSIHNLKKFLDDSRLSLDQSVGADKRAASASAALASQTQTTARAQDQLRIAATDLTTAIINNADRLRGLQEGLVGVFQSAVNLKKGVQDVADAQARYNEFTKAGTENSKDGRSVFLDLQAAQLGQTASTLQAVDGAEKYADSVSHLSDKQKVLVDAQAALKAGKGSFADVKKASDAVDAAQRTNLATIQALIDKTSGPLHDALIVYRDQIRNLHSEVDGLPGSKTTKLFVARKAAETSLATWHHELADTATSHTTTLHLDTNPALQDFQRFAASIPGLTLPVGGVARRAKGGPVGPGQFLVGDAPGGKPELLTLNAGSSGTVTANSDLRIVSPVKSLTGSFQPDAHGVQIITNIGTVNGVEHLNRVLDARDRKLELALRAG